MTSVNWDVFQGLPGSATDNFEMLCRSLIRRHYGQYGTFRALAQQPGVEFHLKLYAPCSLGKPDRWYGWQCRWYGLPGGRAIGRTRRSKIREAIAKTAEVLPDLSDWVLWTRYPLTEGDQEWFYKLDTQMQLHLWADSEVEEHLSGSAEIFRRTYFGDLVLTPDDLSRLHEESTAKITARWQPNLHQVIDAEREIQRILGQADSWNNLRDLIGSLDTGAKAVNSGPEGVPVSLEDATAEVVGLAQSFKLKLKVVLSALSQGSLDSLNELPLEMPPSPKGRLLSLPRQLRSRRHPAALAATNLLADIRSARAALKSVADDLGTRQIAVVAEYGCGKTHLAAQTTAPKVNRPAGVLLHGRSLNAGGSLNLLAGTAVVQGSQVSTMEALVAAVDAAGRRAHRRLPIVIDGLNEAEDPRDWKGLLASLDETLRRYTYALVVTTVRPEFADEVLPDSIGRLEISDYGEDTTDAIDIYFGHYLIDATDAELPLDFLTHPLILRMFCEVANPERLNVVGVEAMPLSLTGLFDQYLEDSAKRIAELSSRAHRYFEQDVRSALSEIGAALWEGKSRDLSLSVLRKRLHDDNCPWNVSLARALEQDGILLRVIGDSPDQARVAVVFDALAGHLIAHTVLAKHGSAGLETWLQDPYTLKALTGPWSEQHPLAADMLRSFAGLVPRKFYRQQFWTFLDEPLRTVALRMAAELEGAYIDSQTVDELAKLVAGPPSMSRSLFDRLLHTQGSTAHPLNSDFLDMALRPLSVAERDIRWTEWIRNNDSRLLGHLQGCEERWRSNSQRDPSDRLRAQLAKWMLTSTVRGLRDQATETLYWYGRGSPEDLFEITVDALSINDPYVYERLLAASYGVVISNQSPCLGFAKTVGSYLQGLNNRLVGPSATHPTNDQLARLYVQDTVAFALYFCPDEVPESLKDIQDGAQIPFLPAPTVSPLEDGDAKREEVHRTLHMDFENYTLGSLFDDRRNYDMDHPGHKAVVAYVLGTVWELGWRKDHLGAIDEAPQYPMPRSEPAERYGKKYGWIGFRAYAGMVDGGKAQIGRELLQDRQIDPSFPGDLLEAPIHLSEWTKVTPRDHRSWIRKGRVDVPNLFLTPGEIGADPGPWVATYGYLADKKPELGREVFGFVTALLVEPEQADELILALKEWNHFSGFRAPNPPRTYTRTFAGEIPWRTQFVTDEDEASLYVQELTIDPKSTLEIEILSHYYTWEGPGPVGYLEAPVPSKSFSAAFGLRGAPQTFDQKLPDGTVASKTLHPPGGFSGHLLYLREDLIRDYARGRELVWFIWGERTLLSVSRQAPRWLSNAYRDQAHIWRHIIQHSSL